jgi:hypothetical protein
MVENMPAAGGMIVRHETVQKDRVNAPEKIDEIARLQENITVIRRLHLV